MRSTDPYSSDFATDTPVGSAVVGSRCRRVSAHAHACYLSGEASAHLRLQWRSVVSLDVGAGYVAAAQATPGSSRWYSRYYPS